MADSYSCYQATCFARPVGDDSEPYFFRLLKLQGDGAPKD